MQSCPKNRRPVSLHVPVREREGFQTYPLAQRKESVSSDGVKDSWKSVPVGGVARPPSRAPPMVLTRLSHARQAQAFSMMRYCWVEVQSVEGCGEELEKAKSK